MSWHLWTAAIVGYLVLGAGLLYLGLQVAAWFWWPIAEITAWARVQCHGEGWNGLRIIRWWALPKLYLVSLKHYWTENTWFQYGAATSRWDCAIWHHPRIPFSFGRIEWLDRPSKEAP